MKKCLLYAPTMALALAAAGAWAQAPAPKPTQPAVCNNCHKPAPGQVAGYFENVAFKSQAIQLGIDANKEIVRFDPKTLRQPSNWAK
jgi:hypothetical protein